MSERWDGNMKCMVCGVEGHKFTPAAMAWDWFHGYLMETVHFCPQHKNSQKRNDLFRLSQIKPEPNLGQELLTAWRQRRERGA